MRTVKLNEIQEEIKEIERKLTPDEKKLQEIYDEINNVVSDFQVAILNGSDEEVNKLTKKLETLQKQKDVQKSLKWATEHGQLEKAVKTNSKLSKMVNTFEKEQIESIEKLVSMKPDYVKRMQEARENFAKTISELRGIDVKIQNMCNELETIRAYVDNPAVEKQVRYGDKYPQIRFHHIDLEKPAALAFRNPIIPEIE